MNAAVPYILVLVLLTPWMQSPSTGSVWDGVYTEAQAARGKESYMTYCSRCHRPDLSGGDNPALTGPLFLSHWMEDSLKPLFEKVTQMPTQGEKPTEEAHVDLVAYLLQANMFPAGKEELKKAAVDRVQLIGKDGPGPVPDFALVTVVGCLNQNPAGSWLLTNASEPVRTRNPEKPTEDEIKAAAAKPLGKHTFLLLSPQAFRSGFQIDVHKGNKMEGKGLLIRTANDQRLNITWLEKLGTTCP